MFVKAICQSLLLENNPAGRNIKFPSWINSACKFKYWIMGEHRQIAKPLIFYMRSCSPVKFPPPKKTLTHVKYAFLSEL